MDTLDDRPTESHEEANARRDQHDELSLELEGVRAELADALARLAKCDRTRRLAERERDEALQQRDNVRRAYGRQAPNEPMIAELHAHVTLFVAGARRDLGPGNEAEMRISLYHGPPGPDGTGRIFGRWGTMRTKALITE